jgi:iron(III) transport system permease protein
MALVVVCLTGGVPLATLGILALGDPSDAVRAMLSTRMVTLLANTVALGLLVALLVGGLGTGLGILLTKTDLAGRRALIVLLTCPIFVPPYLLALGWFTVLGRQGLVKMLFGPLAGVATSDAFFGLPGAVLVLTVAYTPIVLHLVRVGLGSIDPATEEAARLRFRWPTIIWRIHLPLITPAVALGMLLTFILVVGEFGVPAYLRYPVLSGAVFTQFAAFLDIRAAVVTSIPLGVLVLGGVATERFWLRRKVQFLERARATVVAPLHGWWIVATSGAWMYAVIAVGLPLSGLFLQAGGAVNYVRALQGAGASMVTSLWTAAAAATVIVGVGVLLAYLIERTGGGRRNVVDTVLLLLFAVPGTVLGVALIQTWNRPGLTYVYASVAMILIGFVAHYAPLATRLIGVSLQAIPMSLEEAARVGAGVRWTRMIRHVLLPILAPGLATTWALAFIFCLRDLDLAMTIHPPGIETLPIRLYTIMANTPGSVTAAFAIIMIGLTMACGLVLGVGLAVARRSSSWS